MERIPISRRKRKLFRRDQGAAEKLSNFVRGAFTFKECMTYVGGGLTPKCGCGASAEEHYLASQMYRSPRAEKSHGDWSESLIVNQGSTNAFGTIKFMKGSIDTHKLAQYVRIADTDNIMNVKCLFSRYWKLREPHQPLLCLSIIGGVNDFKLEGKKRDRFCKGLITAAQITNAWILTSGLNVGIVSIVGDAVQKAHIYSFETKSATSHLHCIGISPWGYTRNRHQLINSDTNNEIKDYCIVDDELEAGQSARLDENHTHYLFVDDGLRNSFIRSRAMHVRATLEELISRPTAEGGLGIPVVQIIVEGGYDVLVLAGYSVEHNISIVVCSGTGRAANLLDAAIRFRGQEPGFEDFTPVQKKQLERLLQGLMDKEKAQSLEPGLELLRQIVKHPNLLNRVDLGQSTDLDRVILYALIKTSVEPFDQIHIALKFDRVDLVREHALDKRFKAKRGQLEFLMDLALVENRPDFVELLLELGLDVNRFVNHNRLRFLYNNTTETDILQACLKTCNLPLQEADLRKRHLMASGLVEQTMQPMAAMAMGPNSSSTSFILSPAVKELYRRPHDDWIALRTVGCLLQEMTGCAFTSVYSDEAVPFQRRVILHPYRELFIWAIFFNRPQMVDLFWRLAREPVALGLIGCNLYNKIEKCLPLYDTDGQLYMQSQKLKMETATLQVVDRCYAASHGMTTYLLDRRSEDTDGCTCTELAAQAHCLKFMSSVSCQYAIDFAWCAGVKANGFVIILAYFCPLLLLSDKLFIFCTESTILEEDNDNEEACRSEMKPLASTSTHGTEMPGEEADDNDDAETGDGDYTEDGRLKFCVKLQHFYTAPRTKFYVHSFAYIVFLIFYAYVLLFAIYPDHLSICEMVLMVCLGTFFVETIRSMIKSAQQPGTYKSRPCKWLTSYSWHAYDIVLNLTNITGALLRIGLETTFIYAKSVSAVSYILFFVRLFQHYSVNHKLGPKIQMIVQMFKELLIFMVILAVFLVSSGVAMQSLLYPYRTEFNVSVLLDVVYIPYYRIYGELNLDEANAIKSDCTVADGNMCPMYNFLVPLLMAIYMIAVAVLLINLLIAIFSNVFSSVELNSREVWKFTRYSLMIEYRSKTILPPPFLLFEVLVELVIALICACKRPKRREIETIPEIYQEVEYMQRWAVMKIAEEEENSTHESVEGRLKSIQTTVEELSECVGLTQKATEVNGVPVGKGVDQKCGPLHLVQEIECLNDRVENLKRMIADHVQNVE